jgi:hypothetical protein
MNEVNSLEQLTSIDNFFYYGLQDLSFENKCDMYQLINQPKNSMYYNRSDGGGVDEYVNFPIGFMIQVGIKYNLTSAVARRNSLVTSGSNNTKNRQTYTSQNVIDVQVSDKGNVDVNMNYYDAFDFTNIKNVNLPVGVKT